MSNTISKVLAKGEIYSWFQSIVNLHSSKVIGYEALTRGPAGKFHFPVKLFNSAKRCGLLKEVEKACLTSALKWSVQVLNVNPELKIFVNLNPLQTEDIENIVSSFNNRSIYPNRLVFEITEHTKISDFKQVVSTCKELKKKGYLIAIDDVGSGYDRLRSIAEVCPDYIKIDRPMISGTLKNSHFKAVIKSVVALATEMRSTIIAEGIENAEELQMMKSLGISIGQGYFFSRPVPAEAILGKSTVQDFILHG